MKRFGITRDGATVELVGVTTIEGKHAYIVKPVRYGLNEGEIVAASELTIVNDPRLDTADTGTERSRPYVRSAWWEAAQVLSDFADAFETILGRKRHEKEIREIRDLVREIRVQAVKRARQ